MTTDSLKNRRLVGVFLLCWLLFNYPILSLFSRPFSLLGIPLLYIYVFVAWTIIVILIGLVTKFSYQPPPGKSSTWDS